MSQGRSSVQPRPARSLATQRNVSASGANIGATDTLGAIANPTSAPNNAPCRVCPVSMNRSIAHNADSDANTVNGSGR